MPVIRIDDEVFAWLKSQARPFEDTTPNSVLRRIAGIDTAASMSLAFPDRRLRRTASGPRGEKTPQGEYRIPILQILLEEGGRADRAHVLKELERVMGDRLTDFDRQDIKSGTIRWQKSAEWEVSTMRQAGLLRPQVQSPRGVWCLTQAGEQAARASRR